MRASSGGTRGRAFASGLALVGIAAACDSSSAPGTQVRVVDGVRHIATAAREAEPAASVPLAEAGVLLFLRGAATRTLPDGRRIWADPESGRTLAVGGARGVTHVKAGSATDRPIAAVAAGSTVLLAGPDGRVDPVEPGATAGFVAPGAVTDAREDLLIAVRTAREFALAPLRPDEPYAWLLRSDGTPVRAIGVADTTGPPLLSQLTNAAWAAFGDDGSIYTAAALRPELRRYTPDGRLAWISRWTEDTPAPPPTLAAEGGHAVPRFREVQHAVGTGPDGRIWVLAAADGSGRPGRVLGFDEDGVLRAAADVPDDAAIFVTARGAVHALPAGSVTGALPDARAALEPFTLPVLGTPEDSISLEALAGSVIVVNFWASWCAPCREEMPALDRLARERAASIGVLGVNEDADAAAGLRFARALGVGFPSVAGGGAQQARYGIRGLPYTVVLDRSLRVVGAVYGFGGDVAGIERLIATALDDEGVSASVAPAR